MKIKRKYVLLGLALLVIAWLGNIFYYQKHVLKEPLFVKHYYDVVQGMDNFRLYYINNINSKDDVVFITFPEIDEKYPVSTLDNFNTDGCYYNLKIITININKDSTGNIPEKLKNKIITKAKVYLKNGREMDVDIGRIYLYSEELDERGLHCDSSGGSSNNSGFANFSSNKSLKVLGITYKFPELKDEAFTISINGTPLKDIKFPYHVNPDDNLRVDYEFKFNTKDMRRNNAYDFKINVLTEDAVGKKGENAVYADYWLQSPAEYDIDEIIRNRGND